MSAAEHIERIRAALEAWKSAETLQASWNAEDEYSDATDQDAMTDVLSFIDQQAAEIARMRSELHQHECNNFEAVREQRDFLLASQALLIESAKAGQDAQAAEIESLKRGEYICLKCCLRKDADSVPADF